MALLAAYSVAQARALQNRLRSALLGSTAVDQASQAFAQTLAQEFDQTVLTRVFSTVPFQRLPDAPKSFAARTAREARAEALLVPGLPVLTLMGTHGLEPQWRDRNLSKRYLAVPLLPNGFTESLPMISALLSQFGFERSRLASDVRGIRVDHLLGGQTASVFHVEDARSSVDAAGRKVIPAQDFVERYAVRTVYGMGGHWPDGTFVTCIVFTRELLDRPTVRRLAPILTVFGSVASPLVARGAYFAG